MKTKGLVKIKDWGYIYTIPGAIKEFGLTENFGDAGFVLKDGTMLDLSEGGDMGRVQDHRVVVSDSNDQKRGARDYLLSVFCARWGAIRFFPYTRHCSADIYAKISSEQKSTLRDIAEFIPFQVIEVRAFDRRNDQFQIVKTFEGEYDADRIGKIIDAINSNFIDLTPAKAMKKPKRFRLDSGYSENEANEIKEDLESQDPGGDYEVEEEKDGTFSVYENK